MSCPPFSIDFEGDAETVFASINAEILVNQGTVTGDADSGLFRIPILFGHISGDYSIAGQLLTITITHDPVFIGCEKIESEARSRLAAL